ncbi:hypothetical protein AB0J72_42785 [Dactylosporangium sp. NPDC049742]|uniref:hypothetical protein n=1 Tax=Dactylosporangium sp. NPDC049742 TaxID=3154737 RepID=UPI003426343A
MTDQPAPQHLLTLARAGELEPLLHLCDGEGEGDVLAYKWLTIAAEAGYPNGIQDGEELVEQARGSLTPAQRAVFATAYPEKV